MSKMLCDCGHVIRLSEFPNNAEFALFSDRAMSNLASGLSASFEACSDIGDFNRRVGVLLSIDCATRPFELIECMACGRLYVFRIESPDAPATVYTPSDIHARLPR